MKKRLAADGLQNQAFHQRSVVSFQVATILDLVNGTYSSQPMPTGTLYNMLCTGHGVASDSYTGGLDFEGVGSKGYACRVSDGVVTVFRRQLTKHGEPLSSSVSYNFAIGLTQKMTGDSCELDLGTGPKADLDQRLAKAFTDSINRCNFDNGGSVWVKGRLQPGSVMWIRIVQNPTNQPVEYITVSLKTQVLFRVEFDAAKIVGHAMNANGAFHLHAKGTVARDEDKQPKIRAYYFEDGQLRMARAVKLPELPINDKGYRTDFGGHLIAESDLRHMGVTIMNGIPTLHSSEGDLEIINRLLLADVRVAPSVPECGDD